MANGVKKLSVEEIELEKKIDLHLALKEKSHNFAPNQVEIYLQEAEKISTSLETKKRISPNKRKEMQEEIGKFISLAKREQAKQEILLRENKPKVDSILGGVKLSNLRELASCNEVKAFSNETINANTAIEDMLIDQMLTVHEVSMSLLAQLVGDGCCDSPVEMVEKCGNLALRFVDAYQKGAVALNKLRNGGKQEVVVRHQNVQVNGGQAIVGSDVAISQVEGGGCEK